MNTFLYVILAIIGTIFGSFFTLAVYRIPRKENIIYGRSHCTSCNHKLNFFDLIPVLSYVFLGGKCRYCKEPIRPRYLLLEMLSGLVFVLIALAMNISVTSTFMDFVVYVYAVLMVSVLSIIMGIGKNINISVVIFGMLIRTIYFIIVDIESFNQFFFETAIFLIVSLVIYILADKIFSKKDLYLEKKYPNIISTILLVSLLIYIFGMELTAVIMLLGLIIGIIPKYALKKNTDFVMYIMLVSIFALIIVSNNYLYEYIVNIF